MGEFYKITKNPSRDYTDRYKGCDVLEDLDSKISFLSSREIHSIPRSSNDTYHRLQSHEVNRLDLLAHQYYKNPLLWWVIAQANDIYDPYAHMEVGTLIRIPAIETLYGNNGILL